MYVSIHGQVYFLTVAHGHLLIKIKTCFFQELSGHFDQIVYVSFKVQGNETALI